MRMDRNESVLDFEFHLIRSKTVSFDTELKLFKNTVQSGVELFKVELKKRVKMPPGMPSI